MQLSTVNTTAVDKIIFRDVARQFMELTSPRTEKMKTTAEMIAFGPILVPCVKCLLLGAVDVAFGRYQKTVAWPFLSGAGFTDP